MLHPKHAGVGCGVDYEIINCYHRLWQIGKVPRFGKGVIAIPPACTCVGEMEVMKNG